MKILFHLGHPAHFHLFKYIISELKKNNHKVAVLIKKKDVLENLLANANIPYVNILSKGRKDNRLGIIAGIIKKDLKLWKFCKTFKPDLLAGTSAEIGHIGTLLKIPSVNFNEDDVSVIKTFAKMSYPWNEYIISPQSCDNQKWNYKTIKYDGYHELSYLHPDIFKKSKDVVKNYINPERKYFIIRLAKLTAHHDKGVSGISEQILRELISILEPKGRVLISSEKKLPQIFERYRAIINPLDMHHLLAFSDMYIGDSQTMAAESGVLGVPFIRFNDFVGRIGYLNEIENEYKLGYGIKTHNASLLFTKTKELLKMENKKNVYQKRKNKMIGEKINVCKFITWLLMGFPHSARLMMQDPNYQYRFK